MKRIFTISLFLLSSLFLQLNAQTSSDFENINLSPESFWNGSDLSGGFESGNAYFPNVFNPSYGNFNGFAVSNITDNTTSGYENQYAAVTGAGYNNSSNYGLVYVSDPVTYASVFGLGLRGVAAKGEVSGMYVTNSAWAALSMRDGGSGCKKFGGESGNDPDWFKIEIKGFLNGQEKENMIEFYLADFRFEDNTEDYIVMDWQWVDLMGLGNVDSLTFALSSTDNNAYGMMTPSYFCMDNLTTMDNGNVSNPEYLSNAKLNIYPNPSSDFIVVESNISIRFVSIYDVKGCLIADYKFDGGQNQIIDVQGLAPGLYLTGIRMENGTTEFKRFVKK